MQPCDEELMKRTGDGDLYAFDTLVGKCENNLINLIYKTIKQFKT